MKKIITVDLHHEVLVPWEICRQITGGPLSVLSLDFHTDVLNCARRGIILPGDAAEAVQVLHHDEHFDWALRKNIISQAKIISLSPCAVQPEHANLTVCRSESLPDMDEMLNGGNRFRPLAEMVLSDTFLAPLLADGFPSQPYILDIDCDFILCEKALFPEKNSLLLHLAENAELITLSRENDWVRILKLAGENISGTQIAAALTDMFSAKLG